MTPPLRAAGFTITPSIASNLLRIEAARALVDRVPFSQAAEAKQRFRSRVRSSHFSTLIEGNRLTLEEARAVIVDKQMEIPGREKDVADVRNYWNALHCAEVWACMMLPLTDIVIRRFHRLVMKGVASRPTPFRNKQIEIRDPVDGILLYLPPKPEDLPELVAAIEIWAEEVWSKGLSPPLIAGVVHYQLAAIYPFDEGNDRCAHLIDNFILHRGGYGLKGLLSIEEEHYRDLQRYFKALHNHPSYDYYDGRDEVDLTSWLEYFVSSMAESFKMALLEAHSYSRERDQEGPEELRNIDPRARRILGLLVSTGAITAPKAARELHISVYMIRKALRTLMDDGWVEVTNPSRRVRECGLSAKYRQCIGKVPEAQRTRGECSEVGAVDPINHKSPPANLPP